MNISDEITSHFRLRELQKKALKKLHLETIEDLLFYFPNRFEDPGAESNLVNLQDGAVVIVEGMILSNKTSLGFSRARSITKALLQTKDGNLNIVWFNQPYVSKKYKEGANVRPKR